MTFDPDAWITGIERPFETTTLHQRPDLADRIHQLEKQIEVAEADNDEETLGGVGSAAELNEELHALYQQWQDTTIELKVVTLDRDEMEAIVEASKKSSKEAMDAAAAKARKSAQEFLEYEGIKDAKVRTERAARAGREAAQTVLGEAVQFETLHRAVVNPETGERMFTADQWRAISSRLGSAQVDKVWGVYTSVSSTAPEVTAPKSLTRGTTGEDQSL